MSIRASVSIATSLDGFIARRDGLPLFAGEQDTPLTHVSTTAFDLGPVQSTYTVTANP